MVTLHGEKEELDAMVERLSRSPRLADLLRYLGDRYLRGESATLREYEIATEVFHRQKDFDPGEDAIARVEAHRLRKKLKLYYESEGRDNLVRITIPAGSYTPVFTHAASLPRPAVETPVEKLESIPVPPLVPEIAPERPRWRIWLGLAVAAFIACAVALGFWRHSHPADQRTTSKGPNAAPISITDASLSSAGLGGKPIRILAGYEGQPHMDPAGNTWLSDRFFARGGGWHGTGAFTARTNDEFLYRTYRTGEFEYIIPLSPGSYELHLFFDETAYGPGLGGGEGTRSFNLLLNHQKVLHDFDIVSDSMGANIADERVIRDVGPDSDGKLHLEFEGISGKPVINAMEILPGEPHRQLPIRLTTQPMAFIDRLGNVWEPDNYFLGGQSSLQKPTVAGTQDPGLFATERYGHFSYALPVDPRGRYTLTLYFAEFYFGPEMVGKGGAGDRRFNVFCNGAALLRDFDIFSEAGPLHALSKTFHHLQPSPQGKLDLTFEPISNYANISAIEVTDESR